jgi:hypothetical protein
MMFSAENTTSIFSDNMFICYFFLKLSYTPIKIIGFFYLTCREGFSERPTSIDATHEYNLGTNTKKEINSVVSFILQKTFILVSTVFILKKIEL